MRNPKLKKLVLPIFFLIVLIGLIVYFSMKPKALKTEMYDACLTYCAPIYGNNTYYQKCLIDCEKAHSQKK